MNPKAIRDYADYTQKRIDMPVGKRQTFGAPSEAQSGQLN